jgi:hypothetical protein
VANGFDPGALLARFYRLPRGPRVCLRLVRTRDRAGIGALFERNGLSSDELELTRLLRVDPRRELAIVATALVGSYEMVVGVGAIELGSEFHAPRLLVVDSELTEGLDELLSEALIGRARTISERRAA